MEVGRGPPRRFWGWTSLAVALAVFLSSTMLFPTPEARFSAEIPRPFLPTVNARAPQQFDAAVQSLENGGGPAIGGRLECSPPMTSSARCSAASPSPTPAIWRPAILQPSQPGPTSSGAVFDPADNETVVVGLFYQNPNIQTWLYRAGNWTELPPTPNLPVEGQQNLVYDTAAGYVLMTGDDIVNDSWALVGSTWAHLPIVPGPATRSGAAIAYDPALGAVILFGGTINTSYAGDTWEFRGNVWTLLNGSVGVPPPRTAGSLVYDPTIGKLLLYGGNGIYQGLETGFNDTWAFSSLGWVLLANAGGPSTWFGAIEELFQGPGTTQIGLLLFEGGANGSSPLWIFNGNRWSETPASAWFDGGLFVPPVLDQAGVEVLFGFPAGSNSPFLTSFQWSGSNWSPLPNATTPAPSEDGALVDDPDLGGVLYMQLDGNNPNGWVFVNDTWTQVALGTGPLQRSFESVAYDPSAHAVVMFGGEGAYSLSVLGDTWLLENLTWSRVIEPPGGSLPPPGWDLAMTYDARENAVILLDGSNATNRSGTWEFVAGTWEYQTSVGPVTRQGTAMAYDALDQETVLFGGDGACGPCNDTWTLIGGNWKNVTAPGPRARTAFGFTTGPNGGVLLFGGVVLNRSLNNRFVYPTLGDTWSWTNAGWSNQTSASPFAPSPREYPAMAYDTNHQLPVLFGGGNPTSPAPLPPFGDTWTFSNGSAANALPIISFSGQPADLPIGNATALVVTMSGGATSQYNYTNLSGGCVTNDTPVLSCAWSHPGVYEPTVMVRDKLGGNARARTIVSEFPALSVGLFAKTNTTTPQHGIRFHPAIVGGIPPFQMVVTPGDDCGYSGYQPPEDFSCVFSSPGVYSVYAHISDSTGALGNASVGVCVFAGAGNCSLPQVRSFTSDPPVLPLGGTVTFVVNASGFTPLEFRYRGLPPGCASGNVSSLRCTPLALGTYSVEVTVQGPIGPIASATTSVVVLGSIAGQSSIFSSKVPASWLPWMLLIGGVIAVPACVGVWFFRPRWRREKPASAVERGPTTR
jgi:hypothetical protein